MVVDIGLYHCYDGWYWSAAWWQYSKWLFALRLLKIAVQGPVSRIVKYESFLIYDFLNLGTSLRRSVIAFLEALCKWIRNLLIDDVICGDTIVWSDTIQMFLLYSRDSRGVVRNQTKQTFYSFSFMHQSIESPGGGGRDGAGIVHRPPALFCIVPAPRGTFFCH